MKRALLSIAAGLVALSVTAGELQWHTDLAKAKAKAKAENKLVLINFTGSDWCGFCIKQQKEVFSTDEFAQFAEKNLVLVEIDFPRKKEQAADLKAANAKLKDEYKIEGFPTLVFLNGDGKKLGQRVGYGGGGPKPLIEELKKLKS